jgi:hypothetical protein
VRGGVHLKRVDDDDVDERVDHVLRLAPLYIR